jgi:hypothetical protein
MLYKLGSKILHEGRHLDTLIVEDAKAEAKARKDGYSDLGEVE